MSLTDILRGILWFPLADLVVIILVIVFPEIITLLPEKLLNWQKSAVWCWLLKPKDIADAIEYALRTPLHINVGWIETIPVDRVRGGQVLSWNQGISAPLIKEYG